MTPTAPACTPQISRNAPADPDSFWQRPRVKATLRAMYVVCGVGVAVAAFVVVGFYAAFFGCYGVETSGLCVSAAWLIPILEWPIFLVSWLAPLAGGIASYVRRDPVWLGGGIVTAIAMAFAIAAISGSQTSALS